MPSLEVTPTPEKYCLIYGKNSRTQRRVETRQLVRYIPQLLKTGHIKKIQCRNPFIHVDTDLMKMELLNLLDRLGLYEVNEDRSFLFDTDPFSLLRGSQSITNEEQTNRVVYL